LFSIDYSRTLILAGSESTPSVSIVATALNAILSRKNTKRRGNSESISYIIGIIVFNVNIRALNVMKSILHFMV